MNMYDFGGKFNQIYTEKCPECGNKISVSTQKDECPEYYTTIYVMCNCGVSVKFVLPVN